MATTGVSMDLATKVRDFVLADARPGSVQGTVDWRSDPCWRRIAELGGQLWLDTGSLEESAELWSRDFAALTTNNSLLNREVQKGTYDAVIPAAADLLRASELSPRQRVLEIGFILNALHGLRLVQTYGAYVSVEEHTDLADDVGAAVACGRRYYAICPERFIIKAPMTPAGLLATRRLTAEGIPVNHTLGFSARQNYVAARLARPTYVNVFLGRLNSFVADNGLGTGMLVGEKATLASQAAIRALRSERHIPTGQIGASFRAGGQIRDLVGIDVMTLPPKVAREFLDMEIPPDDLVDRTRERYRPRLADGVDAGAVGLGTLWDVEDRVVACMDALESEEVDTFTPVDLLTFFAAHDCGDVLVDWTDEQVAVSAAEGKIPKLDNWRDALAEGEIGLDALMNLAGLNAFRADQKAMDDRVESVLRECGAYEKP